MPGEASDERLRNGIVMVAHDTSIALLRLLRAGVEMTGLTVIVFPPREQAPAPCLADILEMLPFLDIPELTRIQEVSDRERDISRYPTYTGPLRGKPRRSQIAKKPPRYLAPRRN